MVNASKPSRLNPYSNGMKIERRIAAKLQGKEIVLILILME